MTVLPTMAYAHSLNCARMRYRRIAPVGAASLITASGSQLEIRERESGEGGRGGDLQFHDDLSRTNEATVDPQSVTVCSVVEDLSGYIHFNNPKTEFEERWFSLSVTCTCNEMLRNCPAEQIVRMTHVTRRIMNFRNPL